MLPECYASSFQWNPDIVKRNTVCKDERRRADGNKEEFQKQQETLSMKKEGLYRQLLTAEVSFSFVNSAETLAQAKTSSDMSLVNPSNQLDYEKILSNWDEYLAPAPMGIAIMSQLLICSTRVTDFKINRIDKNKIHLLIHPDSFCTTLVQIANESYEAFMLAHTNMEKIQLQMAQVPDYVKECVKLIQSNNKNAIKNFLPRRLKRIEEAAADGLTYSTQVRDAFDRLGQLIRQVILAIQASRGARTEEIEELIRKEIEEKKKRQEEYKQREQDLLQKEMEGAQEAVQRTQKNLEEACKAQTIDYFTLVRGATSYLNKHKPRIGCSGSKKKQNKLKRKREKSGMTILKINVGKEVSTDEMIKLLQDGTKKLGEMHEKWAGMTMYFEHINNHIDKVTKTCLDDFVNDAKGAQHDTSHLEFMEGSIAKSLESSIKSRHVAATYVKVSDNYIMEPLKQMHGMLSIEPAKLEETQKNLLESCTKAMQGIQELGIEDRNKTIREIENKVQSI
uniref:Uncharacterized protein n=1 Tax=Daphnia galeata TaxID=27404 RepID=A0A8J2WRZ5_9CRUS|nr:unnamed protein product [Daphnia galeata]